VCHQNWQGADCSERTCPFELAFVDTALRANDAHYYAECANKGVCDRKTGECKCFDGYDGKGCQRSVCPNDCSGHGTCEFIDELANDSEDRRVGGVDGLVYSNTLWDWQKIQGCKCDMGFEGADCSLRLCAAGDDPLTAVTHFVHEKQRISIGVPRVITYPSVIDTSAPVTIADAAQWATALTVSAATDYTDKVSDGDVFQILSLTQKFTLVSGGGTANLVADQGIATALVAGGAALYRVKTNTLNTFNAQTHLITMTKSVTDLGAAAAMDVATGGHVVELGFSNLVYVQQSFAADVHLLDKYVVITDSAATATAPIYIRSIAPPAVGDQFFVTYYDPYGGMWNTTTQTATASVTDDATSLQTSLRSLPMRVLDDVSVAGHYNDFTAAATPVATGTVYSGFHEDGSAKTAIIGAYEFIVTFQGTVGTSGFQHLFEVEGRPTPAGSFPLSAGLFRDTNQPTNIHGTALTHVTKEGQTGKTSLDRSELATCSNRGLCDSATGQCTCFSGFRGLACEFQEALV